MQCRNVLTRIDALRTGELRPSDAQAVHEHLGRCRSCDESAGDVALLATAARALSAKAPRSLRENLLSGVADHFDVLEIDGRSVFVAFSERGIRMISTGGNEKAFRKEFAERIGGELERGTIGERLRKQVVAAVSGEGVNDPAVDWPDLTEFERNVLEILTRIPKGEVRTYAWVARQAGRPKAVRAVGNVCARNVLPFVVPCHRVVPTGGGVGQYAFGSPMKRELLRKEGVAIDEVDELAQRGIRFVGSRTTRIFCCPTCRDARRIREENRVFFHDEKEAATQGFRGCKRCHPAAA